MWTKNQIEVPSGIAANTVAANPLLTSASTKLSVLLVPLIKASYQPASLPLQHPSTHIHCRSSGCLQTISVWTAVLILSILLALIKVQHPSTPPSLGHAHLEPNNINRWSSDFSFFLLFLLISFKAHQISGHTFLACTFEGKTFALFYSNINDYISWWGNCTLISTNEPVWSHSRDHTTIQSPFQQGSSFRCRCQKQIPAMFV